MGIFDLLSSTIAIAIGSHSSRIQKGGELVYDEPTVLSINKEEHKITGIGKEIITTHPNILIRPYNYVISDFQGVESYLRGAIKKLEGKRTWLPKKL